MTLTRALTGIVMLAAASCVTYSASLHAAQTDKAETPEPTAEERPALPDLVAAAKADTAKARLAAFDRALAKLIWPTPFRGMVLCIKATALADDRRERDALAPAGECGRLLPDHPAALGMRAMVAYSAGQAVDAATLLIRTAQIAPERMLALDADVFASISRQLLYLARGDLNSDLMRALSKTNFARDQPALFSTVTLAAMRSAVANDPAAATALLPGILDPADGLALLVDRRFAAIWPAIDRWAAGGLTVQRDAMLRAAKATFEAAPTPTSRNGYAIALDASGSRAAAISLLESTDSMKETNPDDDYAQVSGRIVRARLLRQAGRNEAATRLLRSSLEQAGETVTGESASNYVPNLAWHLVADGRAAEAAAVLDRWKVADVEAEAAKGYFVALRSCIAALTGRSGEATALLSEVSTLYGGNGNALDMALACSGTPDTQAANWIARATDTSTRGKALTAMALARTDTAMNIAPTSPAQRALQVISHRADVQATFNALGRMPAPAFIPALHEWNAPPPPTGDIRQTASR